MATRGTITTRQQYYWLARAHTQLGDEAAAGRVYMQAVARFPENSDFRRRALVLCYRAEAWSDVIALASSILESEDDPSLYYWLARAHTQLGDEAAAGRVYMQAPLTCRYDRTTVRPRGGLPWERLRKRR